MLRVSKMETPGNTGKTGNAGNAGEFQPKIVAFICNWCTYAAADLAGVSRLQMPPNS